MSKGKHIKGDITQLHNRQNEVKKKQITSKGTLPPVILYNPHQAQAQIHQYLVDNPNTKYITICCGRRFGKSALMLNQVLLYALQQPNEKILFLCPSTSLGKERFDELFSMIGEKFYFYKGKGFNISDLKFNFINGSSIKFKTFDVADNLVGGNPTRIVIDEAAIMPDATYYNAIKPYATLCKSIIALSTPRGKIGWFYKNFCYGSNDYYKNYKSFQFPTIDNPQADRKELKEAKENLPEHIYKQEYEAEFIDNANNIFKNIENCINNNFIYNVGDRCVCGVDIGRQDDKTIITVMRIADKQVIFQDGWNKLDYNTIVDKVAAVINQYKPIDTIVETNSIGDFFFDALKLKTKHKLTSFYTLNSNKNYIIENLILAFEKGEIKILDNGDMIFELNNFTCTWNSASRTLKYGGRSGVHDDRVMSLAFAYEAARRNTNTGTLSYSVIQMPNRNRY